MCMETDVPILAGAPLSEAHPLFAHSPPPPLPHTLWLYLNVAIISYITAFTGTVTN